MSLHSRSPGSLRGVTLERVADSPLALQARGIVRRYGDRPALDGFSVDIPAGSVFGLLGPNGSGKSTFLALVASMSRPDSGDLLVFGAQPSAALKARVGMVFQENAQDPTMTVMELLALAGTMQGMKRPTINERASSLLRSFGLVDRAADPIAKLSGGMRRRLEVARALMHDPQLLLLDEPTTGIDPDERQNLWQALLASRDAGTRTVVLATNDLAEADAVCDRVAFLRAGVAVATGTPTELKSGLRAETVIIDAALLSPADIAAINNSPGTGDSSLMDGQLHITCDDASSLIPRLFTIAPGRIRSVSVRPSSLEDAYFQHVGRRASQGAAK